MRHLAGETQWRHPKDEPPPLGTKLLLLQPTRIAIIGNWEKSGSVAWAPLPDIDDALKRRLEAEAQQKRLERA